LWFEANEWVWLIRILVDAFNPMQSERYDLFKRAKLRKESLRRIVNHALSQSVPASVVTTVNGFTKVFAGEMVEKARTVQAEWAEAHDQAALAEFEAEEEAAEKRAQAKAQAAATQSNTATPTPSGTPVLAGHGIKKEPDTDQARPSSPVHNPNSTSSPSPLLHQPGQFSAPPRPRREFRPPPNPHRGQLLPAHLREALRRSKRDGEGGGVGFSGMSLDNLGVKGSVTWNSGSVGGRRLFR
jgi:transcription initiation factor TFIID subunit 11